MNCFSKPLLNCVVFVIVQKLFHLFCCPLWDQPLVLNLLPEIRFVEVWCIIRSHDLKQFDSLYNGEFFLLTNIKFLARNVVAFRQKVIIFLGNHFGSSNHHWIDFVALDGISDPITNIDWSLIKILHFHLGLLWLYLVSEALVLVNENTSMLINECFQIVKVLAAFRNVKH